MASKTRKPAAPEAMERIPKKGGPGGGAQKRLLSGEKKLELAGAAISFHDRGGRNARNEGGVT